MEKKIDDLTKMDPWRVKVDEVWRDLGLLAKGGHEFKAEASRFLAMRAREHGDIYAERLRQVTYTGVLPAVSGWYAAAVQERPAVLSIMKGGQRLVDLGYWAKIQDDLQALTAVTLGDHIAYGIAFYHIEAPPVSGDFATRQAQEAAGALDFRVRRVCPESVISFTESTPGSMRGKFARIQTRSEQGSREWVELDEVNAVTYREVGGRIVAGAPVRHAGAAASICPLIRLPIDSRFWLGNRVYLELLAHVRAENGLDWSLENACYPMPYIKGQMDDRNTTSAPSVVTYLQLSEGGDAGWIETSGTSFVHAAQRCSGLRESIYRTCYLVAMGRDSAAAPAVQSGTAKELDMAPSSDVLADMGRVMRAHFTAIAEAVKACRSDGVDVAVSGLDFDDQEDSEVEALGEMADLGISSPTARKVLQRRWIRRKLAGEPQEVIDAAEAEIEASAVPVDMGNALTLAA